MLLVDRRGDETNSVPPVLSGDGRVSRQNGPDSARGAFAPPIFFYRLGEVSDASLLSTRQWRVDAPAKVFGTKRRVRTFKPRGNLVLIRTTHGFAAAFFSLLAFTFGARAQSVSGYFAAGTATDSSAGEVNTLNNGTLLEGPKMGGFFETVGGDFLFFHNLGVGAEAIFRKDDGPYAGLLYRTKFFDINADYRPRTFAHRFTPEFQLGAGRANISLYDSLGACYKLPEGCAGPNAEVISVGTFQAHGAAGLRIAVFKGIFIRPQFDLRWVQNNFSHYFGSSWVYEYSVGIGYTYHFNHSGTASK
jgi:hypothetical protein